METAYNYPAPPASS